MRRRTKIICTLGPSCHTPQQVEAMARAGMNVARINLAHGTWEEHRRAIHIVQAINRSFSTAGGLPSCVAVLLDTKGAEVRTGTVKAPIRIAKDEEVLFSHRPLRGERLQVVQVSHAGFAKDAREAERILLDNGKLSFTFVKARKDGAVLARAGEQGTIGSRRHVNLPGANLQMPSITEEDWESIRIAADEGVDFVGLSFIRKASEIEEVRAFLEKRRQTVGLVAKIETRQAIARMREIVDASDAVMVARGDLGAEIPFEQIPVVQDQLVSLCRDAGKPVIVATHMLESMIENPLPTRAEVTDIAHAAASATDVTMLSGETAAGAHPLAAIDAMDRVLRETETHMEGRLRMLPATIRVARDAQAEAAVTLAISTKASAIVAMTRSGQTARDICRFRPHLPVIAFTPDAAVQRSLQLSFGVIPMVTGFHSDPEQTVEHAVKQGKAAGLLKRGQQFVLVSDARTDTLNISTIQVRKVA